MSRRRPARPSTRPLTRGYRASRRALAPAAAALAAFHASALRALPAFVTQQGAPAAPAAALARHVSLDLADVRLADALKALAGAAGLRFAYGGAVPQDARVTVRLRDAAAGEALRRILLGTGVGFTVVPSGQIILTGGAAAAQAAAQGAQPAVRQTGRLTGRVLDARTGEPVPGALVSVVGAAAGAAGGRSDVTGRYALAATAADQVSVLVRRVGFAAKTVTGVRLAAGRTTTLDVTLDVVTTRLQSVVVTADRERSSTSSLLIERKQAATVSDVLGADQIARSTDSDVGAAVRRMPGTEVREGKYVYVRGMGDRYGNVTLNGVPIPSITPDRKAVPLDLIPSSLLESVVTTKGVTPDLPADYTGGTVQLRTLASPPARVLRLTSGTSYNTVSTLHDGYTFGVCGGDWTGFSRCGNLSAATRDRTTYINATANSTPEQIRRAREFAATVPWGLEQRRLPLNQAYGLTYGDTRPLLGRPVGFVTSANYSNANAARGSYAERVVQRGATDTARQYLSDYGDSRQNTHEVRVGGLANVSVPLGAAGRVGASGILNRLVEDRALILEGLADRAGTIGHYLIPTIGRTASTLASGQLQGDHVIGAHSASGWLRPLRVFDNTTVAWRAAYSRTDRVEPGTRGTVYLASGNAGSEETGTIGRGFLQNGPYAFVADGQLSGRVVHQDLSEIGRFGTLDLGVPFRAPGVTGRVKFGGVADSRGRDVYLRRVVYQRLASAQGGVGYAPPQELFQPQEIGDSVTARDDTRGEDNYTASQWVRGGYAMLDATLFRRLRVVGGGRAEITEQTVEAFDVRTTGDTTTGRQRSRTRRRDRDVLPSINLTYAVTGSQNLRAGFGRTLARPQFRELAPFQFQDWFGSVPVQGNPRLRPTRVHNADLRWEWFARPGAVVSAGAFYKRFHEPIEPFIRGGSGSSLAQRFVNTREARTYGGELELRLPLGVLAHALDGASLNANYTALRTRVDSATLLLGGVAETIPPERRVIFGQTPYLINVSTTYDLVRTGSTATVLFNRAGERIETAGTSSYPSVFEVPRSEVDVVLEQRLRGAFSLKASVNRLTGHRVRYRQYFPGGADVTARAYDVGRTFALTLSWSPGAGGPAAAVPSTPPSGAEQP